MAKVLHTCSGCVPIDASIIDVYTQLISASVRAEAAAKKADEASLGKAPYVGENGNWWEWDEQQKAFVDTGIQAETGMIVDDEMSDTSTYPVQNKVVKEYIDEHTASDPDAVKYTEQSLTSEQKAQARTNIGAQDILVSGTNLKTINQTSILGSGDIVIPKGDTGDTPDFSIGTVTTGAAGSQASATITGTDVAPVLNLTIPQGYQGNSGYSGAVGELEVVNNLVDGGETAALSAEMGKELGHGVLSARAKNALYALLEAAAYSTQNAQSLLGEFYTALYNLDEVIDIEATFTQGGVVFWDEGVSSLDDLKPYLVVKAVYGDNVKVPITNYTLSGTLTSGTSTITVTYEETYTDTFDVVVSQYGSKMSYSLSSGDLINPRGAGDVYDTNKRAINDYLTSTQREVFVLNYGKQQLVNKLGVSLPIYPIKVPSTATSVTATITPNTQFISVRAIFLDGYYYYINQEKGAQEVASPYAAGSCSMDLVDKDVAGRNDAYILLYGKPQETGGSFNDNEPTQVTVTFE